MIDEQQPATKATPTCYKHPDRETRVSCGKCGKPLCPDCVQHGPVGVRCRECLLPPKVEPTLAAPEKVGMATGVALAVALLWVVVLVVAALAVMRIWPGELMTAMMKNPAMGGRMLLTMLPAPNLLLSGFGGGLVGWIIWRICGCTWNTRTMRLAVLLGGGIPLIASGVLIVIAVLQYGTLLPSFWVFNIRVLVAVLLGAFFAWASVTSYTGGSKIFK